MNTTEASERGKVSFDAKDEMQNTSHNSWSRV